MSNIYDDPKDFGLEIFEAIDDDHASYSYDMFVIWKRLEDGRLFYGTDGGCSCPTPFEDMAVGDLTPVTTIEALDAAIEAYRDSGQCTIDRKHEVVTKVKEYLSK